MTDVLVVAELLEGKPRKSTYAAITCGKQVAEGTGGAFDILSIGDGAQGAADELKKYGARKVLVADVPSGYVAEKYAPTIAEQAKSGGHGAVVAPATIFGKDLMPRVAAKLEAGIAQDISALNVEGGKVTYVRPIFAGNVMAHVQLGTPVQVVTARQSEFEAPEPSGESPVESVDVTKDPVADKIEFVNLEQVKSERPELTEAEIVVSGGRALKSSENFKTVLEPLVDALGAAMGASRAACDAGYVATDLQVGQTGKVVAPKLYIAVGISGAIQHLAGMKGSKTIVAINKDKEAPIAQVADYFVVADLFKAVPEMTEAVKKVRTEG
ncbi:MAG: electron transfer flavoprotein subunit alpha/FixB family protein [Myxococcota bacterium]